MKKNKTVELTRPTWGTTLTPVELLQLLDLLDTKRRVREINRATVAQERKHSMSKT